MVSGSRKDPEAGAALKYTSNVDFQAAAETAQQNEALFPKSFDAQEEK